MQLDEKPTGMVSITTAMPSVPMPIDAIDQLTAVISISNSSVSPASS